MNYTKITAILIILLIFVCFYVFLPEYCLASGNIYYVDPKNGDDSSDGSLSNPWRTVTNSIPKLKPGNTLYLRGGTYLESNIKMNSHGTESEPIVIKNYPGDVPVIDGGYRAFRDVLNSDWEVYDSIKDIYRSVNTYSKAGIVHGYFGSDNGNFHLVPYERYSDLSSDNQDYTDLGDLYVGPGVFWNSSDKRIYVRLTPSKQAIFMGYTIPANTDPRQIRMYVFSRGAVIRFENEASYINIEGLDIRYQNNALEFSSGSHHIFIKDSNLLGGRTHVLIRDGVNNLTFDNVTIDDSIPPWLAWTDVKRGQKPAHSLQQAGIGIKPDAHDIEIKNSEFNNIFDAIDASKKVYNVRIHHNRFTGIRDDVLQLGSASYNVEVGYNKMIYVSKGVSRNGSGSSLQPGTKYIHHNIIDTSQAMLYGRNDPNGLLPNKLHGPSGDGMAWSRPFGSHRSHGYGNGDPWKIYNNTIICGKDLNNKGAGHTYRIEAFYPNHPQEVYNNIFVQLMDHWLSREARVSDGSQMFDGNIYFRRVINPTKSIFISWKSSDNKLDFMNLDEFKYSHFFRETMNHYYPGWENSSIETDPQLDSEYYPDPNGSAATGSIDLSSKGWPGVDGGKYRGALPPIPNLPQNLLVK
jgi:hypothetical protein